jgi:hypothetical protein
LKLKIQNPPPPPVVVLCVVVVLLLPLLLVVILGADGNGGTLSLLLLFANTEEEEVEEEVVFIGCDASPSPRAYIISGEDEMLEPPKPITFARAAAVRNRFSSSRSSSSSSDSTRNGLWPDIMSSSILFEKKCGVFVSDKSEVKTPLKKDQRTPFHFRASERKKYEHRSRKNTI